MITRLTLSYIRNNKKLNLFIAYNCFLNPTYLLRRHISFDLKQNLGYGRNVVILRPYVTIFCFINTSSRSILVLPTKISSYKRSMHRISSTENVSSSRGAVRAAYNAATRSNHIPYVHSPRTLQKQDYAAYRVHTPEPSTSSEESLKNNPPVSLYRKKGSKVIQHSEVVEETCETPGCSKRLCDTICNKVRDAKSVGHVGHSEEHNSMLISNEDLEGNPTPQYMKTYDVSHDVQGESANPLIDEERTKRFKAMLKAIEKNNQ